MSKKSIIWIVVAVVVIGGILLFSRDTKPASGEPIKIGGLFSLSGYAAFAGEASRDGFLMAIEDSGMDVEYVVEDFKSETKSVVTAARKLLEVDKVGVVIGPEWAEFGEVAAPIADETKTVFISPWMNSETDWAQTPYYFSGTPSERSQQKALIQYMKKAGDINIALVYSNNSWSLSNIKIFKEEVAKDPSFKIAGEFIVNQDALDYRTEISKIKNLAVDAVFTIIATDDGQGLLNKQMKELGVNLPVYLSQSRAESPVLRSGFSQYIEGMVYGAPKAYEKAGLFEKKYEERFGKKPGAISAATAYDMTTLVLAAIKEGATNSEEIKNYLENVKDYEGYSNKITFNESGQVASEEVEIRKLTKEGFVTVE